MVGHFPCMNRVQFSDVQLALGGYNLIVLPIVRVFFFNSYKTVFSEHLLHSGMCKWAIYISDSGSHKAQFTNLSTVTDEIDESIV